MEKPNNFRSICILFVLAVLAMPVQAQQDYYTISGRASFKNRSSLYDKVELFEDPEFWGRDNIIEPTESLIKAIGKLKRLLLKDIQ